MPEITSDRLALYLENPFSVRAVKLTGSKWRVSDGGRMRLVHIIESIDGAWQGVAEPEDIHPYLDDHHQAFKAAEQAIMREAQEHARIHGYDAPPHQLVRFYAEDIRDCAHGGLGDPLDHHRPVVRHRWHPTPYPHAFVVAASRWVELVEGATEQAPDDMYEDDGVNIAPAWSRVDDLIVSMYS